MFETSRILQIQNPVLNVATVDVPGVMYLTRGDLVSMDCTLLGAKRIVYTGLLMVIDYSYRRGL